MGRFSGVLDLLITLPKDKQISIVRATSVYGRNVMGKTRPHCHNYEMVFLGDSSPLP